MPHRPARVFIVRHGERKDHVDPQFHVGNARPHDSPLTDTGKRMARLLGKHLVNHRKVAPNFVATCPDGSDENQLFASNVVILTSPLQRCVETSHGICTGIVEAAGVPKGSVIPMYLETGIMEGPEWLNYDMEKARVIKRDHVANSGDAAAVVEVNIHPVVLPHDVLKAVVGTEHLMPPRDPSIATPGVHPENGLCLVPASFAPKSRRQVDREVYNRINSRAGDREREVADNEAALNAYLDEHVVGEDGEAEHHRCRGRVYERTEELARHLGTTDHFAGMDVILVGHGETTQLVNNNFPNLDKRSTYHGSPFYTAWTELVFRDGMWTTAPGVTPFEAPHLVNADESLHQ